MERLEVKATLTAGEKGQIAGYASLFGRPADAVRDVVKAGAFRKSLADAMPQMLAEHQGAPVGEWEEVVEDDMGLRVKGRFDLTSPAGRKAYEDVSSGRRSGLSIGYLATKAGRAPDGARILEEITLVEISVVENPASSRARVLSVKSDKVKEDEMSEDTKTEDPGIKALEAKLADLEKKADPSALTARLDKIEAKINRGDGKPEGTEAMEMKALAAFVRTGSDHEIKAATSASDPEGGYFILPSVDLSIRNLLADVSPLRQLAEVVSIGGNTYERFYSTGNRGAQWVGETDARPQDTARPNLIKHSYGVSELYAAPAGTRHLFEDASIDIGAWFTTWAVNDFAVTEGEAFLNGAGVNGRPRGLTTYPRVATADATRGWGEMQYLPAGHASAPTDDNWAKALVKTVLTLHPRYRPGAAWLMNNATLIRIREIQDSNKRFMWSDHGNLSESPEGGTLLGYPVHVDNNMDDIGTDLFPIAFGNFAQGYVIVDRHGIRIVRDEVSVKGTILLDTYKRVGGGLGDSNAIKWLKVATS